MSVSLPSWLRVFATSSALILTGCQAEKPSQYEMDTAAEVAQLGSRVTDLEAENKKLREELADTRKLVDELDKEATRVSNQVSQNAKIANSNMYLEATERGDCGYETYRPAPQPGRVVPVVASRPIPCTEKNYGRR